MYNPSDWYWLADDGRVYSSKRQVTVDATDEDYLAWTESANSATIWPCDDAGAQTDASLQAVLNAFSRHISLYDYAAMKRYTLETGGFMYSGHPISTDRDSQSKIGNVALAATIKGQSFSTDWKCSDGTFFTLTQATAVAMATAVMAFISACFATEGAVAAEISSGSIQTFSQIDAAPWPEPAG